MFWRKCARKAESFPVVESYSIYANTSATTHTLPVPSGTATGDLLLAFVTGGNGNYGTRYVFTDATITGVAGGNSTTNIAYAICWRIATSSGNGMIITTDGSSRKLIAVVLRISGAHATAPVSQTFEDYGGTLSAVPVIPEHNAGAERSHLWLASAMWKDARRTVSGDPTDYSLVEDSGSTVESTDLRIVISKRDRKVQTENPSDGYTISANVVWAGVTVAIRPA
jgi:hypothetical protein